MMIKKASSHLFFEKARKLETDDPKLFGKRKVSSHYDEGETPA